MRNNRKKHKTLKFLSDNFIELNSSTTKNPNFQFGKSFEDIESELKLDKLSCEKVYARLELEEEVGVIDTKIKGLHLTQKGLDSYVSKKYLLENENIILSWFKVFVQIFIPIVSLIIALLALSLKFNSITDNIEKKVSAKYKQELEQIESKLDSILQLENNRKNNSIPQKSTTD